MDSATPPRPERHAPRVNSLGIVWRVFVASFLVASLFTAYTPLGLIPYGLVERLSQAVSGGAQQNSPLVFPTATPRPRPRLGIVAGHYQNDSGAQCADGLTEADVNLEIATRVRQRLIDEGFDVDLLAEYDDRLTGYQALALVSIHADTCDFISNEASGYKVAPTLGTLYPEKAERLVACLRNRYEAATGLQFHPGSITRDMTSYHAFDEIHNETTAVIIETGFLNLDRQILTTGQDRVAEGIVAGILCYLYNEDASSAP